MTLNKTTKHCFLLSMMLVCIGTISFAGRTNIPIPSIKPVEIIFSGGDIVNWSEINVGEDLCRISNVITAPPKAEFNFHRITADFSGTGTLEVSIGYSTSDKIDEMINTKHLHSYFRKLQPRKEVLITSPYKGQRYAWVIIRIKGEVKIRKIHYTCRQTLNSLYGHLPGTFLFAGAELPYRLLYPKNYDPRKSYPLVVSVSGSGGVGTDNYRSMEMITLARYLYTNYYHNQEFECFSLVPQIPSNDVIPTMFWPKGKMGEPTSFHPDWPAVNTKGWYARASIRLIKELAISRGINIDKNRIYLTGFSYGGKACWEFLKADPNIFAAAASGGGWPIGRAYSKPSEVMLKELKSQVSRIKHVPVFIFAGENDAMRFSSKAINDEIIVQGGKTRFKIYKDASHVSAAGRGWADIENIRWLFSHKRK